MFSQLLELLHNALAPFPGFTPQLSVIFLLHEKKKLGGGAWNESTLLRYDCIWSKEAMF